MRRFVDDNGEHYTCSDAADFVRQLHATALHKSATDQDFIDGMAERMRLWSPQAVRTDTPDHFLCDLIAVGWLREVGSEGNRG